ncbi:Rxt3 [Kluyveromyces lactis]|nr:Rxt3 [Kluyveromyces lactis]
MSDELYRKTQNRIYSMQETLLNSSRESKQARDQDTGKIGSSSSEDVIAAPAKTQNVADESSQTGEPENNTTLETAAPDSKPEDDENEIDVNSKSVLEYTEQDYALQRRPLATLEYDSMRVGVFPGDPKLEALPFPYNFKTIRSPRPFIPRMSHNHINSILTIQIDSIYLQQVARGENIRYQNREIWGTDIYTDDSDIILVLQHCGVLPFSEPFDQNSNGKPSNVRSSKTKLRRTPANMSDQNSVTGAIPEREIPFAIKVDILMLPPLQGYASSTRNNITSREWTGQVHDGLSYGIFHVDIVVMDNTLNEIQQSDKTKSLKW